MMREREELIAENRRLVAEVERLAALARHQSAALAAAGRMLRLRAIGAAERTDCLRAARDIDLYLGQRLTGASSGRA